ncbi:MULTISPECIES: homocysteine S-methyltransferase family protein [unclassified Alteromonas]|uniref:homocysteine S-methyltransferase family protein n=1 Tax=unclassified Alteromonas TaxID=2614992 RepID=UPI000AA50055|nr:MULTISPECIES: homocysteine S-methyltransferase family protein [unclassified Alteromonas]
MENVTILDGGMGQELVKRSKRELTPLWSADVMLHEPNLVRDVHAEFIESGAEVITLNTYTATPQRLTRDGSIELIEPLHEAAIKAAQSAVAQSSKPHTKIAACLPPLVASYHPDDAMPFEEALSSYQQLVALQKSAADIFLCETMSSLKEAKAACTAAKETGKPVWVAFSVSDSEPTLLRGGEPIADAIKALSQLEPQMILLNCSRPEAINAALNEIHPLLRECKINFGVYANGFKAVDELYPGDTVESLAQRKDLSPEKYAEYAVAWAQQGASVIGGCCEISPLHIKAVSEAFKRKIN